MRRDLAGWIRLSIAMSVIAALWIGVLPALSRSTWLADRRRFLDENGINPASMIATDHPATAKIQADLDELHQRAGARLWWPWR